MDLRVSTTCFREADEAPLRVLVLPHAGGLSHTLALKWKESFQNAGLSVELWGVDWTWETNLLEQKSSDRALDLVAAICRQLCFGFFGKPFVLVGHSLGALVALALTHYLEERKLSTPRHVFFSGSGGPSCWLLFDNVSVLQRDEELIKLLQQWGDTDKQLLDIPEQSQKLLTALRVNLILHNDLVQWYKQQHGVKIHSDVTVLGGSEDIDAPLKKLIKWKEVCAECSDLNVQLFPGGHFYLTSAEIYDAVVEFLIAKLRMVSSVVIMESLTLINGFNSKINSYPSEKCLHDMFYEAAKRTPDAIAIYYEGKTLTFREVDDQSERLADYLYNVGVRPNCISGIFMEHCVEFVIAYIAALKAGGAYMPLEIVYPPDLLERAMQESKPIIVLTKKWYRSRLPAWQQVLELDDEWLNSIAKQKIPVMPAARTKTHPDDLAYVVMSSGTTGVPKGICCPHRGAVHSYDWRLTQCPYSKDDRVACHVFFVWELLRPMLGNRPLYIIPDNAIYDPTKLVEYLATHHITRILFTPSLLQLVLDTCSTDVLQQLTKLRLVWLCGEVVTLELRNRFVRLFPDCELQNLYSVSECHDVSAVNLAALSESDISLSNKYASCGKVMPNVKAFVLDDALKPVSLGVPGELYIGGPCLAIGYLNRPSQTAQRFLKNVIPGETLYKTGDRARFLLNGHLELIGRCDFMVKIRGYSVVLGAVESALAQHPLVSTSVVLTEGDEGEDKRLIAYIVPEDWDKVPSASNLREFLNVKLPHYAIPSVFVQLNVLPINSASGKLDRKLMPSLEKAKKLRNESIDQSIEPKNLPQTETEKKLALLWMDLLRLEHDNNLHRKASFFDVGGHSLLSTRLISSIRDTFGIQLTLADILSSPELCAIASHIDHLLLQCTNDTQSDTKLKNIEKKVVLSLEAAIDASIFPAATRNAGYSRYRIEMVSLPPRNVFLTGATGFLGVHLLHALLKFTTTIVFCLVRAEDEDAALVRIKSALKEFALLDEARNFHLEDRVIPVPGNLAQPLLGLTANTFKMLATEIDAILHNGAEVNLAKPYSALKSVNVLGTQEVLRLAVTNGLTKTRVKPVHYISTNGVFPSTSNTPIFFESADISELSDELENGYAQSKWVAERMCQEAALRGLPVSILRPGNMAPSSSTGQWNSSDFMYLLLKGCADLNAVPACSDWYFDMTPVDYAARAIVHFTALHPKEALGQTLHIQNPSLPIRSDSFFRNFAAMKGSNKFVAVEYCEWKHSLHQAASKTDASLELQKLAAGIESFENYLHCDKVFDSRISAEMLQAVGITCPTVNEALLAVYTSKWFK
ncbi:uncharacterized protein CCR75_005478 [Bremia lactucae]|uniref:Carrier domain-containing protein n=1 Tax=Bremia lactucae TaxID=4779 RepID=A0A976IK40_BRELC|nr:hypothetical protein CCR75_005478 [Bremia lactucae]